MAQSRLEEIRKIRLEKLAKLRGLGINPYPSKPSHPSVSVLSSRSKSGETVSVAGRLHSWREHGNVIFADLRDSTGQIQLLFQKKNLESKFDLLNLLDVGDFLGVTGQIMTTQAGETTVDVTSWEILSKSLRPVPDDWFGLKDEEARYRQRYVDLLLNDDLKKLFRKKAVFWQSTRDFLVKQSFLEVETPVLENTAGGADANPFITHHNALDINLYLRISMGELWQKRLMVAGFDKTFEIGRQFRNEGISREHLQDYSQMEFYRAYADYEDSMKLVEDMYKYVAKKTFGKLKFDIEGQIVDLSVPWEKIDYTQTILEKTGQNIRNKSLPARELDQLWKSVRKSIAGPAFLVGHPVEVSPLAKRMPGNTGFVERYQVIIAGSEMGNGYSELNDPVDQAERFASQQAMREAGDEEAQMNDTDFVTALEYGMPPVTGFGVSERLFSFLANLPIRETVLFPLLRPESDIQVTKSKQDFSQKYVIVINNDLPAWKIMNTSGHIAAFLGNKMTSSFDTGKNFITKDGTALPRNSQYPIVTLTASPDQLKQLIKEIRKTDLLFIGYVPEMMDTTDDTKLAQILSSKTDAEVEYTGIGIFGPNDRVDSLTKKFSLWGK